MNPTRSVDELRTVASGIDHPEGVAWHDGALWCGTESGDLLRIDVDSGATEVAAQPVAFSLGSPLTTSADASLATLDAVKYFGSRRAVGGGARRFRFRFKLHSPTSR